MVIRLLLLLLLLLFTVMYQPNNQCHQADREHILRQLAVPWEDLLSSGEYVLLKESSTCTLRLVGSGWTWEDKYISQRNNLLLDDNFHIVDGLYCLLVVNYSLLSTGCSACLQKLELKGTVHCHL